MTEWEPHRTLLTAQVSPEWSKKLRNTIIYLILHVFCVDFALAQTTNEEFPFLWGGKVYADPNSGITPETRKRYRDLPNKYPNAASCIVIKNEVGGTTLIEDLIWENLHNREEVEVWLFRALSIHKTDEKITDWMLQRGWLAREVVTSQSTAHLLGVPDPTTQLGFFWDAKANGALYGDSHEKERYLRRAVGSTATVTIDSTKGVLWLRFKNEPKWRWN